MIFKDDAFKLLFLLFFFFTVEENRENCLSELENNFFFYFFNVERILNFIEQGLLLWDPYSIPTTMVW